MYYHSSPDMTYMTPTFMPLHATWLERIHNQINLYADNKF